MSVNEESDAADRAWNAVADVRGWLTRGQSDLLVAAAQACPRRGRIVEIGSFQGRSAIVLALSAPPGAEVIAIDPHAGNDRGPGEITGFEQEADDDYATFRQNLRSAGVAERVQHIRLSSDDAIDLVPGPIDVLFIDGAHRYRPALSDIERWGQRVGAGGTLLIHDAFSSVGVTLAIARTLMWSSEFEFVLRSRSLAVYRKTRPARRLPNLARQGAQLGWFAKNVGLKVVLTVGGGRLWALVGRDSPEWPY